MKQFAKELGKVYGEMAGGLLAIVVASPMLLAGVVICTYIVRIAWKLIQWVW